MANDKVVTIPSIKETVEMLRKSCDQLTETGSSMGEEYYGNLMGEAADTIERLERALEPFAKAYDEQEAAGELIGALGQEYLFTDIMVQVLELKAARRALSGEPT